MDAMEIDMFIGKLIKENFNKNDRTLKLPNFSIPHEVYKELVKCCKRNNIKII